MCESGYGLIYYCLIDTCRYVLFVCSLIQQRLNIGLCKNSTPRGYWVYTLVIKAYLIHFVGTHIEKGCHLVDKCPRSACAGTVHSLVRTALKENYLCILSAKLYYGRGVGLKLFYYFARSEHFLNKGDVTCFGKTQSRRA